MGNILPIIQLGHPTLRKKTKEVKNIPDPKIQQIINDLLTTVMEKNGVGLAAPQINQSYRIFVVASHPNDRYPYAPDVKTFAVINPKITRHSKETEKDWEGCLSTPGIRGLIPRHKSITVEYLDKDGNKQKEEYNDFIAKIFQHENDHLDGIMFLDRLESNKDIVTEQEFQKLISNR